MSGPPRRFRVRALARFAPLALPVGATLLLLSGPVLGATTDDEEYRNTIASLVLHARAVLDGEYPYWTSELGFGLPHPLHPTFVFHPLMPLFGLWPVGLAVRALYVLHGAIGAVGAWMLIRRVGVSRWIAGLGCATWVLATPALSVSQTDFWPSNFIGWSLAPFLLLLGLRILEHPGRSQPWAAGAALGATAGFLTVTGHAGQQPALFFPLAMLCLGAPLQVVRRLPVLIAATALGGLIASPVVVRLMLEVPRFPDVARQVVETPTGWPAAVQMLVRPFESASLPGMFGAVLAHGDRLLFFGGPMVVLAVLYILGLRGGTAVRVGLPVTFVAALVLVFLPSDSGPAILPGTFVFQEPAVLTGTVMGCLALQAIATRARGASVAIGVAQTVVLVLGALPFIADAWHHGGVSDPSLHRTPLLRSLQQWRHQLPGRWYLAPQLDALVRQGSLYDDGLWRDTWVFHGLPIVNGTFKGVSADVLYPSGALPLGRIEGHQATVTSASVLSVAGIGAVLAMVDEPVADTLDEVARFDTHLGRPVRLLRNSHAWPGAAFVSPSALEPRPPTLENCPRGLLCLDLASVAQSSPDLGVRLTRQHGRLHATFAPAAETRRLMVAEMYRPEWTASAGSQPVSVTSAWGAFLAVEVPPGIDAVDLRYRPTPLIVLTWLSGLALSASGAGLTIWAIRRRNAGSFPIESSSGMEPTSTC